MRSVLLATTLAVASTSISSHAQRRLWDVSGADDGAAFGQVVASGGDVDLDGVNDALVGAPRFHPLYPGPGAATLIKGATGAKAHTWSGDQNGDRFGTCVAFVGDLDGDGRSEIAVGAPRADLGASDAGFVRVYSGATKLARYTVAGGSAGSLFGSSIAPLGDVDGDAKPDFAVGAPQSVVGPGFVRILSGANGSTLRSFTGASTNERFGVSLANVGDQDGDGQDDLAIGAERSDLAGSDAGAVHVVSSVTGATLSTLVGASTFDEFGHAIAGVGDFDQDGRSDLLVGAWNDDAGSGFLPGSVSLWSIASGAQLARWIGITADDHLGKAVGSVGDVDGDGRPDFAYSGRHDLNDQHPGDVYVRSGANGDLLFFLFGDRIEDEFGLGVASLGDVDGDGLGDWIVGAPQAYHNTPDRGYVRALAGCRGRVVVVEEGCPGGPGYPRLFVSGCPSAGATLDLRMSDALPLTSARLRIGRAGGQYAPSIGCAPLVRAPLAGELGIALDAAGSGAAQWTVPSSLPSGTRLFVEALVRIPGVFAIPMRSNVVEVVLE